jgi:spore coat polysaccharide biosynthesis protein SpsF
MNVGILLSVREKATRLPGKVLLPLGKYNITEHLIRRLLESQNADKVIVSTSIDPRDGVLVNIAKDVGVGYYKGSEDDKLIRYRDTARYFEFDFVVIVDGDDPFCSVEHIDRIIEYAQNNPVDYIQFEGLPLGATGFGVSVNALDRICREKNVENTEIWAHLFTENDSFNSVSLKESDHLYNRPDVRMTLDYPEDYEFFKTVINALQKQNKEARFDVIMQYLNEHPNISEINQSVQSKYEDHFVKSRGGHYDC